ncbi:MAG TPA: hypothetical protein VN445_12205 [Rectinemataceae bacterium]|nr:hypothetical protein [Rectinemataceae bacterium]
MADILWVKGQRGVSALHASGYMAVGGSIGCMALLPGLGWRGQNSAIDYGEWGADRPGALVSALLVAVALASFTLLLWSVFFELEIAKRKGTLSPAKTYSGGTYGLCRHPGFWWFSFLVASIGALRGFRSNFFTIFIMIGLDLLLIFIQDCYTFPKVFRGYEDYKKSVPFLMPRMRKGRSHRD